MKTTNMILRGITAVALAVAIGLAGCGPQKAPTGKISGTVTLEGKALAAGTVVFLDDATGVGASAVLDSSGTYRVDGPLRTGNYQVAIQPPPMPAPHEMGSAPTPPKVDIPAKYQDPKSSGLTATVKEGENTADFKL